MHSINSIIDGHLHGSNLLGAVKLGLARALPYQRQPGFDVLSNFPVPTGRRGREGGGLMSRMAAVV